MIDTSYSSPFGMKKPQLNYSGMWSYTFKSFLTFLIIAVLMGCSFYFGVQTGLDHAVNLADTAAQTENDSLEGKSIVNTNPTTAPAPASAVNNGSTTTVNKFASAGEFGGYRYVLSWQETWKTDAQGIIDANEMAPVSETSAVLEKTRLLDGKTTKIGENITFNGDELGSLTHFTEDQSVAVMSLHCRGGCDSSDSLVINLDNGKATILSSMSTNIEQRFKKSSCSSLGFQNTIQNNVLFMCIDSDETRIETIYKYNLVSGVVAEVETLTATETIVCEDGYWGIVTDYSDKDGVSVSVCKKTSTPGNSKIDRLVTVKDTLKP